MTKTNIKIPPLDLKRQYNAIREEVQSAISELCDQQTFILGDTVSNFEKELTNFCGAQSAIGVSSGTDAIILSLMAMGISNGDEVITTPFTFIATAEPILLLGAKPVFVDIDPKTFNLDPAKIEAKITDKTKAIIVVHLYGQTADMEPILALAKKHNLKVIEDTAQAMGAVYGKTNKQAGTMGDVGTLSFFPSKNLGGFGDGGAILTNDASLSEAIMKLRVHGQGKRYHHEAIGLNGRLDALQAVILSVKLKYLSSWLKQKNERASFYDSLIQEINLDQRIMIPFVEGSNFHTYHQYVLKVNENRDALVAHLQEAGIGARVYYPVPLHLQKCFDQLGFKEGDFPESELCSKQILSLPIFPEITEEEQRYIIEKITDFFE